MGEPQLAPSHKNRRLSKFKTNGKNSKNLQHKIYNSIQKKKTSIENNIVVNLSKTTLTLAQLYLLNKGLNFCISEVNKSKLIKTTKTEISNFIRNVQIKYMFINNTNINRERFTGNKKWKPPNSKRHQAINALEDVLVEDAIKLIKRNNIRNKISSFDRLALSTLKTNTDIIIKKADKRGCIVILDTEDYIY